MFRNVQKITSVQKGYDSVSIVKVYSSLKQASKSLNLPLDSAMLQRLPSQKIAYILA